MSFINVDVNEMALDLSYLSIASRAASLAQSPGNPAELPDGLLIAGPPASHVPGNAPAQLAVHSQPPSETLAPPVIPSTTKPQKATFNGVPNQSQISQNSLTENMVMISVQSSFCFPVD